MRHSTLSLPKDAYRIFSVFIMVIEVTFIGLEELVAQAARKVDTGRGYDRRIDSIAFDIHDTLHRVFLLFLALHIAYKVEEFLPMSAEKFTAQLYDAGRISVFGATAGGA